MFQARYGSRAGVHSVAALDWLCFLAADLPGKYENGKRACKMARTAGSFYTVAAALFDYDNPSGVYVYQRTIEEDG